MGPTAAKRPKHKTNDFRKLRVFISFLICIDPETWDESLFYFYMLPIVLFGVVVVSHILDSRLNLLFWPQSHLYIQGLSISLEFGRIGSVGRIALASRRRSGPSLSRQGTVGGRLSQLRPRSPRPRYVYYIYLFLHIEKMYCLLLLLYPFHLIIRQNQNK